LAQSTQHNLELPKRPGNLKHYFTYPPFVQILNENPFVSDHRNEDPDGKLSILISPTHQRTPTNTVITVPSQSYPESGGQVTVPARSGRPILSKAAFQSNIPSGSHPLLPLPNGQTSRILSDKPAPSQPNFLAKPDFIAPIGPSSGNSTRKT